MGRAGGRPDARRAHRVESAGIGASCRGERFVGKYRVENLSTTGALLSEGFVPPVGEPVRLKLLLPQSEVIELEAHVVRHHVRRGAPRAPHFPGALALCFDDLSSEQADALHDTVVDIILRDWQPTAGARPH